MLVTLAVVFFVITAFMLGGHLSRYVRDFDSGQGNVNRLLLVAYLHLYRYGI